MADPTLERIQNRLREMESELLEATRSMLRIPSVEDAPQPAAPFGPANRQALDLALSMGKEWGMRTLDLDGYIGYAEFGQGERLVMSLGHLDVVPVGPGWKHEPFGAEVVDGYIFARGSVDDKGPTMASFFAMRAIQECVPNIPARMRQVFGCNEESGFKCIERYVETEEAPSFGIAPDSGWPLYHAEKGIANLHISVPLNEGAELELVSLSGGQRPNIVIDAAEATVRVGSGAAVHVDAMVAESWDRNVEAVRTGDTLRVSARGKAAHGSRPFDGDSAAIRLFRFLREISPLSSQPFFDELLQTAHIAGTGLGIHGADEISDLTSNLGTVRTDGGRLELLFNVRYPVTWTGEKLEQMCRGHLATLRSRFELEVVRDSAPLYFPLDHPLVKTVCDVYRLETGEEKAPGVMGGGTYARAVPSTVSIGTGWEGDGNAHETDEKLKVDHLFRMSRIYAHILYRLALIQA